jgi:UDP-N-acetylmuramate dehydrogenase
VTYRAADLTFGYRETNIPDPIILGVNFRLRPDDPIALRQRVKESFEYKKSAQPLAEHSAGCVFRNPIDPVSEQRASAGRLIHEAGLKGTRIGGASVSTRHANFIVTEPGATADDVIRLMDDIRRRVFDHAGIELQDELVIWRREEDEG